MRSRPAKKKNKLRPTIVVWTCIMRDKHAEFMKEAEKTGKKLSQILRDKLEHAG